MSTDGDMNVDGSNGIHYNVTLIMTIRDAIKKDDHDDGEQIKHSEHRTRMRYTETQQHTTYIIDTHRELKKTQHKHREPHNMYKPAMEPHTNMMMACDIAYNAMQDQGHLHTRIIMMRSLN